MERERLWDRVPAGRRVMRAMEWLLWDACCWMYQRVMRINRRENVDGSAAAASSWVTVPREEVPAWLRDLLWTVPGTCRSKVCQYILALELTLFWHDAAFFVNLYLVIMLYVTYWICNMIGLCERIPNTPEIIIGVYVKVQIIIAFIFMDTLAPAEGRVCCSGHSLWRCLQKLRIKKPGLHCIAVCFIAFHIWLVDQIKPSKSFTLSAYCILLLASLIMRLSEIVSKYFMSHKEWQCDSEIEDEFLPLVTEANMLVLTRVGETGDHSPTPTSVQSDTQNDSFYDEDFIEGLQEIAFNMPYHGEGSTDGVELSELELSVGENDAEENDIKFQTGHFEKSSSSSSEEEVFDAKKIAASSDESNGDDSDFEIIDKEEIAKIEK
ncbi:PREDICTED: uncharacterized protein LOC108777092 [Cyphomyrmex costatus]|uniref:Uncharacterized protein n=1 Tax=Cyphomyrmex costatus TaxID=456900 RepID=A0A151IEA0_9HYME|nr:PREDICTED: uncharacterized protein LOC108777092 [Cyphomyrmex costatus]KYM98995.1 hypothetical protein ALC62_10294 [Cyphomyrmex costatus]